MFLLPGDSPIGFRLPLDRLPWVKPDDYPHHFEADPMAPRGDLPERESMDEESASHVMRPREKDSPPKPGEPAAEMVRTAQQPLSQPRRRRPP